jgi:hypothetical protein
MVTDCTDDTDLTEHCQRAQTFEEEAIAALASVKSELSVE